jgi:hypothetical protein
MFFLHSNNKIHDKNAGARTVRAPGCSGKSFFLLIFVIFIKIKKKNFAFILKKKQKKNLKIIIRNISSAKFLGILFFFRENREESVNLNVCFLIFSQI